MTHMGGSGFSFIDQEAKSAQSLDQLEWIVAHNVSHELMLAFGVGENYDQTGNYIDARNANWSMMVAPMPRSARPRPRHCSRPSPRRTPRVRRASRAHS